MSTAIALSEQGQSLRTQLVDQLGAELASVLPANIRPERLILTIVQCGERTPKLYQCSPRSLQMAALSMGTLNLECDGFTGQGYLIPFKSDAQPVIGYKGFNTLAARNGFVIDGAVVRDGDRFDYQLGTSPFVTHTPMLRGKKAQIVAAWATAMRPGHAPIVAVMGIDEINAVKGKSPGARRSDSPWNDTDIGLPAMAGKTVKRRLARAFPMGWVPIGDTLESCWERGQPAGVHMEEHGPVVTRATEYASEPMRSRDDTIEGELVKSWSVLSPSGKAFEHNGPTAYAATIEKLLHRNAGNGPALERFWELNRADETSWWDLELHEPQRAEELVALYERLLARSD